MRAKHAVICGVCVVALGVCAGVSVAQQGVGERIGEKVDSVARSIKEGATEITDALRKRFEIVKADVQHMEAQPRVYSRIHWDKALHKSKIEVHMLRDGTVLLRGTVADEKAQKRTVALARDTVGVTDVVDELVALIVDSAKK